jgi:threonine 3-dehydrogenase
VESVVRHYESSIFLNGKEGIMAILVTGGTGFLGAGLTKALVDRGEDVVALARAVTQSPADDGQGKVTWVQGDITSWPEVLNVVQQNNIHTIFHLAAVLSAVAEANPWAAVNTNALGTFHVLEAARLFHVRKVIFASSMGTYAVTRDTVVTEDTPQKPPRIYGVTKVFGELLGLYYHRKFGIDFRGVRFPQIIGPHVKTKGFGQYIPLLIQAAIQGEHFDVWVPEDLVLPLLHIKDAIRSLVMLCDAEEDKLSTRIYNLGQIMPPPTAKDVVDIVKRHFPEARIAFKPDQTVTAQFETIPKIIQSDQAEKEWGWTISCSLADSVRDFIETFRKDASSG